MISALIGIIGKSPWGMQALLYTTIGLLATSIGLGVVVKIQSAELTAAKAQKMALGDKIDEQNRAVATWKGAAQIQAHRAMEAAERAEAVRRRTTERIRFVTMAKIPVACPAAVQWGAQWAVQFSKRWEDKE